MSFDPGAQLDPGQVRDARGRSMGGRGTLAVGGGGLGLIITLAYLLLGGDPSALLADVVGGGRPTEPTRAAREQGGAGRDE